MNLLLITACVLFFLCANGHGHRHVRAASEVVPPTELHFTGCREVVKRFHDGWQNRDNYVSEYSVEDQHDVLVCLDAYAKRRGTQ